MEFKSHAQRRDSAVALGREAGMHVQESPVAVEARARCESQSGGGVLLASELFCGRKVVVIEHAGERYHLRLTQKGKLILTK
jgi:hemin uptake protein HemP